MGLAIPLSTQITPYYETINLTDPLFGAQQVHYKINQKDIQARRKNHKERRTRNINSPSRHL